MNKQPTLPMSAVLALGLAGGGIPREIAMNQTHKPIGRHSYLTYNPYNKQRAYVAPRHRGDGYDGERLARAQAKRERRAKRGW